MKICQNFFFLIYCIESDIVWEDTEINHRTETDIASEDRKNKSTELRLILYEKIQK